MAQDYNARYDVGAQTAGQINNVGRDQFNSTHVQHIQLQRESFFREIAAAKSNARLLIWLGAILMFLGFAGWMAVVLRFIARIPGFDIETSPSDVELLGPSVNGIPVGVIALGLAVLGMVLLTIGVVRHVTATSRRRRVDQELPLPFYR